MEKIPEPRTDITILRYNPDGLPVHLGSITTPNIAIEYHPSWLLLLKYIPFKKLVESDCELAHFLSLLQQPIQTRPKIWLIDEVRKLSKYGHDERECHDSEVFKSGETILYEVPNSRSTERKEMFRSNYPPEEWGSNDSAFMFLERALDKLPRPMNLGVGLVGVLVYA